MSKQVAGRIVTAESPVRSRGDIKFTKMQLLCESGDTLVWDGYTMERSVAERLLTGAPATVYFSKTWSTVYGVRLAGEPGLFRATLANPLVLVMAIGVVFLGLATSYFLFPLLAAAAGAACIAACLDAMGAKSRFKRDERAMAVAHGPIVQAC